jgi:uridine kinase
MPRSTLSTKPAAARPERPRLWWQSGPSDGSGTRDDDVKTDRTRQWLALGQTATDGVIGPPVASTEDSWSVLRAFCVAPVVQLIRASHPRLFAISGPAGAGKSTVASAVSRSLANVGLGAVALSLDDFYLSRRERERRGIAWRAPPGSHDIDLMVQTLAAIQDGSRPLFLPRFDPSRDDRSPDECLEDSPDVVLFDGWIIGFDGQGYGRILPYLDWHLHLDIPTDVARDRRFDRETRLREETGRAFTPEEMERFWDEVLGPGMDTWVRASAEHADIVVRLDPTGPSCLADPRLDEFLPGRPA